MSASTRLETALTDAAEALLAIVGLPLNPADSDSPRIPVSGSLVNPDEVPAAALKAATFALDVLLVGMAIMDPETRAQMSVEDGLARMMSAGEA